MHDNLGSPLLAVAVVVGLSVAAAIGILAWGGHLIAFALTIAGEAVLMLLLLLFTFNHRVHRCRLGKEA